jgi:hypothetical protein
MLIAFAVIGWLLFLIAGYMYLFASKLRVRETQSLAIYAIAVTLSDIRREESLKACDYALGDLRQEMDAGHALFKFADLLIDTAVGAQTRNSHFALESVEKRYYEQS